jgi:hypothetical protein
MSHFEYWICGATEQCSKLIFHKRKNHEELNSNQKNWLRLWHYITCRFKAWSSAFPHIHQWPTHNQWLKVYTHTLSRDNNLIIILHPVSDTFTTACMLPFLVWSNYLKPINLVYHILKTQMSWNLVLNIRYDKKASKEAEASKLLFLQMDNRLNLGKNVLNIIRNTVHHAFV